VLAALGLLAEGSAHAAQIRYHFTPVDANGTTTLSPGNVYGPRSAILGIRRPPPGPPPGTTYLMTYWHPCSARPVTVPVTFPDGTPTIEHARNRIMHNYGSYYVQVRFQPDGSVDVVYDSGLLRGW
jgi:hypothetical protein